MNACSGDVVLDFTNLVETGLGPESFHFAAISVRDSGTQGHDIPVVVREPPKSDNQNKALEVRTKRVKEVEGFPLVRAEDHEDLYTSLRTEDVVHLMNLFV